MEVVRLADQGDVAALFCEFLEVCIHQLLSVREVYPPAIFERRRYFNVPVQWARHPDLREYIHSAVSNLQTWIQQGAAEKIAIKFLDANQIPVEKVIFKLCLKKLTGTGLPAQHLEFALRGFLLKICVSNSALPPLPPDCSWELVAYMKSLSADNASKSQFWIPADPNDRSNQSFTITTIKSMRSSYLDMQLYVERPGVEPQKESKTEP
ncbi:DNA polymerase zeta processivity subunit [Physcomitrium patens]|uniref:HORMA domain-containing protein n=1 Tax=Physcomitrium patens TaxID=3218 RepID=A0A2K1KMH2_PHYPA|nr:DNA polymerase zeta processivity subunit-like [Physcomitrium patens]XP_024372422.1 DNA polymerase zeta processivity subunit-like [Physcomitrium patens]PNR54971.1 hypothetical protein PHYPA_005864 [Physcomitrium patens]|eukprot:XP_024372421.1 DNA polymerase zeta processivity subunit-like [Physcomitrella patens]